VQWQFAADLGTPGVELRLHVHRDLAAAHRPLQVLLQRQSIFYLGLHLGLEEGDAVAASRLGAVHRRVGLAQQVVDAFVGLREQRDADAARAVVKRAVDVVGLLQHLPHLVGHGTRTARAGFNIVAQLADQYDELVAAQACHRVIAAQLLRQTLRRLLEQAVAHRVAACVVDLLEVVEVDEEQRADLPAALRCAQRLLYAVDQQAPVRQPGEGVEVGQPVCVLLGCSRATAPGCSGRPCGAAASRRCSARRRRRWLRRGGV
jgi:hypothetical protein